MIKVQFSEAFLRSLQFQFSLKCTASYLIHSPHPSPPFCPSGWCALAHSHRFLSLTFILVSISHPRSKTLPNVSAQSKYL
jgi:hypothetical protein